MDFRLLLTLPQFLLGMVPGSPIDKRLMHILFDNSFCFWAWRLVVMAPTWCIDLFNALDKFARTHPAVASRLRFAVMQITNVGSVLEDSVDPLKCERLIIQPGTFPIELDGNFAERQAEAHVATVRCANRRAENRDLHGLEAWFRNPLAPRPPRWKMAVATLCGVFPTSFALSSLLVALAPTWPLALRSLTMSVLMVLMLTWGVMPVITRVLQPWLSGRAAN
jgi:hypothetical protein